MSKRLYGAVRFHPFFYSKRKRISTIAEHWHERSKGLTVRFDGQFLCFQQLYFSGNVDVNLSFSYSPMNHKPRIIIQ